ncbi:hypothetical protein DFH28DRAFT_922917 [Melampsora americana]|nr:hypothetical protein DFH28DRAFT_922917 [Melampsora americana]
MPGFILTTKRPPSAWIDLGVINWSAIAHCTTNLSIQNLLWPSIPFHALLPLDPFRPSQTMKDTNSQGYSHLNESPFGERAYPSVPRCEHGSHPTLEPLNPSDGSGGGGFAKPLGLAPRASPSLMMAVGKENNSLYHDMICPTYHSPSITPQGLHLSRNPSPGSPAASSDIEILSAKIAHHGLGDKKPELRNEKGLERPLELRGYPKLAAVSISPFPEGVTVARAYEKYLGWSETTKGPTSLTHIAGLLYRHQPGFLEREEQLAKKDQQALDRAKRAVSRGLSKPPAVQDMVSTEVVKTVIDPSQVDCSGDPSVQNKPPEVDIRPSTEVGGSRRDKSKHAARKASYANVAAGRRLKLTMRGLPPREREDVSSPSSDGQDGAGLDTSSEDLINKGKAPAALSTGKPLTDRQALADALVRAVEVGNSSDVTRIANEFYARYGLRDPSVGPSNSAGGIPDQANQHPLATAPAGSSSVPSMSTGAGTTTATEAVKRKPRARTASIPSSSEKDSPVEKKEKPTKGKKKRKVRQPTPPDDSSSSSSSSSSSASISSRAGRGKDSDSEDSSSDSGLELNFEKRKLKAYDLLDLPVSFQSNTPPNAARGFWPSFTSSPAERELFPTPFPV